MGSGSFLLGAFDALAAAFSGDGWYAYGRLQNVDLMLLPKILVPDIANFASFAFDEPVNSPLPLVNRHHWPLIDPAKAAGSEEEILQCFRQVRDEMRRVFEAYAAGLRDATKL